MTKIFLIVLLAIIAAVSAGGTHYHPKVVSSGKNIDCVKLIIKKKKYKVKI